MTIIIRSVAVAAILSLFSLTSFGADTSTNKQIKVKSEKTYQDARTKDGKKPLACNFKISLS